MLRGEASLGSLRIAWRAPERDAAGGLPDLLPSQASAVEDATWSVASGAPTPRPERHAAFYGDARLSLEGDAVRIWSPTSELWVRAREVVGVRHGACTLPATLALHTLAAHAGCAHVHAALVHVGGRVVLAPGGSGSGKTTLALAFAAHGGELLSDDAVYVDASHRAWPVRRAPHATTTTLAAHPTLAQLGAVTDGTLPKIATALSPTARRAPVGIDVIVVPTLDETSRTRVEPIEPQAVFPVLLGCSAIAMVEGTPQREAMIDVLASLAAVPALRLVAGRDALADTGLVPRVIRAGLGLDR